MGMHKPPSTWIGASPVMKRLLRVVLARSSSAAVARALQIAATHVSGQKRARLSTLARRVQACAASAHVKVVTPKGEPSDVSYLNKRSCRSAVCMLCSRRRAARQRYEARRLLQHVREQHPDAPLVFLTLTSANMPIAQIERMFVAHEAALTRFWRHKAITRAVLGHLTSLEIAVRGTKASPEAGVHSHSILVMRPDYFDFAANKDIYLKQARIVELWQHALRVSYKPICDVRRLRGPDGATDPAAMAGAVREALKYAIAPHKLFERDAFGITAQADVIGPLALALYRRRLVRFAGVFAEAKKALRDEQREARS